MDLCNQKQVRDLLTRYGFHFSKNMGQNFLIAPWVPQQTAEVSGAEKGVGVLEIGPGVGPLTEQLAKRAEKVIAVELDKRLYPVLAETLADYDNVEIVPGDILAVDIAELCREKLAGLELAACANLPYNITTPAITALLEAGCFQRVTVMIQREVARRICAEPGTADYGAFTVLCRYYADSELLYDVPPDCFYPAPKVTSSVIRMTLRGRPPVEIADRDFFFKVVRAAFGQRRKTLLNALGGLGLEKDRLRQALTDCGLPETIRGERLSLEEFARLSKKIQVFLA